MTIVWAEKALLETGWAEAVRIEAGTDGLISKIETGAAPKGTGPASCSLTSQLPQPRLSARDGGADRKARA
jgi:formimidoylglutamate deiminase